jgi:hypothetical protein
MERFSVFWAARGVPLICRDVGSLSIALDQSKALASERGKADLRHMADLVGARHSQC